MIRFGVLGPLSVARDGVEIPVGELRVRKALAALLLADERVVMVDQLVDALWPEHPPVTAAKQVRNGLATLRRALVSAGLPPGAVAARGGGYALELTGCGFDVSDARSLVDRARAVVADADVSSSLLRAAARLWRGPSLAGLSGPTFDAARRQLDEWRLSITEDYLTAEIDAGDASDVLAELSMLVHAHPTRERLVGMLMVALYRTGRQSEALATFMHLQHQLRDQLGISPGRELQDLHLAMLRASPTLDPPVPAGAATGTTRAVAYRIGQPTLPALTPDFVGRESELTRMDTWLAAHQQQTGLRPALVMAVSGTAGAGKTALAVRWAHRAAAHFPDGQLYLNLRGFDDRPATAVEDVFAFVLRSLDVPAGQIPADVDLAAALCRGVLAQWWVLIVLDNAADAAQVRPLLACAGSGVVVVTSRDRLTGLMVSDAARRITLDAMPAADAVALLTRMIGVRRVSADPAGTDRLVRCCARLPLAVRIVGALLLDEPAASLAELADRLRAAPVAGLAVAGDDRASVQVAFDQSLHRQPAAAARLFWLVGAAPLIDVTVAAAAALLGVAPADAEVAVHRLRAVHLLETTGPGRFASHDLLRSYASAQSAAHLPADERCAAVTRLNRYYVGMADVAAAVALSSRLRAGAGPSRTPPVTGTGFATPAEALGWLDAELDNLFAVARRAELDADPDTVWRIADALRGYFHVGRSSVEASWLARAGLAAAQAAGNPRAQVVMHIFLAERALLENRADDDRMHLLVAADLARHDGWEVGESAVLGNLAVWYALHGDGPRAEEHLTAALTIDEARGDDLGVAATLVGLAAIQLDLDKAARAADGCARAAAICDSHGDVMLQARVLRQLARASLEEGHYAAAANQATAARAIDRELGNAAGEADALGLLARASAARGDHTAARRHAEAALQRAEAAGGPEARIEALLAAGSVTPPAEALVHLRRALAVHHHDMHGRSAVQLLTALARTHTALGRRRLAARYTRRGIHLARESHLRLLERQLTALAPID